MEADDRPNGCRTGPLVHRHAQDLVGQQERVRWNGCGTKLVHRATPTSSSSSAERRAFDLGLAALLDGIERRPSRASRTFARDVAARSLAV